MTQCKVTLLVVALLTHSFAYPNNSQSEDTRPNILWLVLEDMSPTLPAYGDHTIETPNISRLANEGVTYTNVYSTSGVCAPSRAALALGMYPSAIGANHMRTTSYTEVTGLPKYEAVPPPEARMLSHYLRNLGYYTSNNHKTDYQFRHPQDAWDESSVYAHWRNRPDNTPFFSVFNFTTTHESGLFEPYGIREIESRHYFSDNVGRIAKLPTSPNAKTDETNTPTHLSKNTKFDIPPYLPDTPAVQRDYWKMYNNLAESDRQIGAVLEQLEQDGLLDSTIIVFYSDHGGPLPRQKRLIYDSGLKVPLIVRYPDGRYSGTTDEQLVSFVDFAPTTIQMAGGEIPAHMHGQSFVDSSSQRRYIHAAADRFDAFTDSIRAVRDERFKYIRNYRPDQAYYLPVAYRERIPTMQELLRLKDAGKLTVEQALWFRESKPNEELFDTLADPHELKDLSQNPKYAEKLTELRSEMDRWLTEIGDDPELPESQLVSKLWQGKDSKPKTEAPTVSTTEGLLHASCQTEGATIGYKIIANGYEPKSWETYHKPLRLPESSSVIFFAHRIGYQPSGEVRYSQ